MTQRRYEYKVVELREGLLGGKMSGSKLEDVLNDHAEDGWQLKALTSVEVKGRIGPGAVDGVLVTLERPVRLSPGPDRARTRLDPGQRRRRRPGSVEGQALPRMRFILVPQTGHGPWAMRRPDSLTLTSPSKSRFSLHFTQ